MHLRPLTHGHTDTPMASKTQQAQLLKRLFIVYSTLCDTLKARKYTLPTLPSTEEDFKAVFGQGCTFSREDLTFFATKENGERVVITFVSSPEKKAISVQQVRNTIVKLISQQASHGIIVHEQILSPSAKKMLNDQSQTQEGNLTVEAFEEQYLLFNCFQHELVPKTRILTQEEKKQVLQKYKCKESQFPSILKQDPMARALGSKKGDIIEIIRPSETAGEYLSYRACV